MYNIAICDDEINFINYIKEVIITCGVNPNEVLFYEYLSGEELIDGVKGLNIDLLILDMQLKCINGYETAIEFRKLFPNSILVFCSGVYKPSDETFKVTPYRYLYKSYPHKKMISEMKQIIKMTKVHQVQPIIVGKYYYNTINLLPDDITYIENARHGSIIHIHKSKKSFEFEDKITTNLKLKELYEILHIYGFEYAHNSYIVNLNYVTSMLSVGEIALIDGTLLTVSRSKLKSFRSSMAEWISHKY